jgi:hypothetical protein
MMNHEAFLFDAVPPCPETVQAAALLAEIEAVIKNHVDLPDPAAAALAVWVLHTQKRRAVACRQTEPSHQPNLLPVCCRAVAIFVAT